MKSLQLPLMIIFGFLALSGNGLLHAQTATAPNEGSKLEYDAINEIYRFKWWGRDGRTYFIQHSEDLMVWSWVPVIESGLDGVLEWGFTSNADRFFLRLRHTDIPTTDPENDDFDGDGLSNLYEIQNGLNPFRADTDGDGLPDGWEVAFGLDPLVQDAMGDPDGDGVPNREDARPNDPSIGRLAISITTPSQGSTIP